MPLYEYQCVACEHRFEVIQKFSDAPIAVCPKCQGAVQKLLSSPAIQFKGSGWYITDYARSGKDGGGKSEGAKKDGSKGSSEKPDASAATDKPSASSDSGGSTTSTASDSKATSAPAPKTD